MFLETERHGNAHVFFDRENICVPPVWDRIAQTKKIQERLAQIKNSFAVFHHLVDKEIQRNRPIDAIHFYSTMMLPRLIELARIVYCPDRFDFSSRYLKRDLPKELYEKIEPLFFVSNLNDLEIKKNKLYDVFQGLVIRA